MIRNALLLPVMLCLAGNGWASGVFNMSPDWTCNLPGSPSNLRLASVFFDQDNYPDLVIGNTASNHLMVYLGNGDGSFSMNHEYPLSNPIWIETADIDDDLDEDVIVRFTVSSGTDSIAVFFNHQDGILSDPVTSAGGLGATPLEVGAFEVTDFTDDGIKDILIAHLSGEIELMIGTGFGHFQTETLYSIPSSTARALDAVDVDLDGDTDIVVLDYGSITVLINDGTGEVTFGGEYGYLPSDVSLGALESVDLNLDTYPDIVTAPGAGLGSLSIFALLGDGNGGFTQVEPGWHSLGNTFCHVTTDDLNLDGNPDAFFHCSSHLMLLGDGSGTLNQDYYYHPGTLCWEAAVADFDLDGDIDYATVRRPLSQLKLEVFLNKTISSGIEDNSENPPTPDLVLGESPVSGLASVTIELPEGVFCGLTAYDIYGRKLQDVYNGSLPSGTSEILWNVAQLAPGCYFLRLESGAGESTTVMCVVVD